MWTIISKAGTMTMMVWKSLHPMWRKLQKEIQIRIIVWQIRNRIYRESFSIATLAKNWSQRNV